MRTDDPTTTRYLPVKERWKSLAACKTETINIFFPDQSNSSRILPQAQLICRTCPVKVACLEYALSSNKIYGVWGGASEKERLRIKKARRLAALPRLDTDLQSAI